MFAPPPRRQMRQSAPGSGSFIEGNPSADVSTQILAPVASSYAVPSDRRASDISLMVEERASMGGRERLEASVPKPNAAFIPGRGTNPFNSLGASGRTLSSPACIIPTPPQPIKARPVPQPSAAFAADVPASPRPRQQAKNSSPPQSPSTNLPPLFSVIESDVPTIQEEQFMLYRSSPQQSDEALSPLSRAPRGRPMSSSTSQADWQMALRHSQSVNLEQQGLGSQALPKPRNSQGLPQPRSHLGMQASVSSPKPQSYSPLESATPILPFTNTTARASPAPLVHDSCNELTTIAGIKTGSQKEADTLILEPVEQESEVYLSPRRNNLSPTPSFLTVTYSEKRLMSEPLQKCSSMNSNNIMNNTNSNISMRISIAGEYSEGQPIRAKSCLKANCSREASIARFPRGSAKLVWSDSVGHSLTTTHEIPVKPARYEEKEEVQGCCVIS